MRRTALLLALAVSVATASTAGALVDPGTGTSYEKASVVVPMTFPVIGATSYSDNFLACRSGCARMHMGQDLMGAKMSPVVAAFDGVVSTLRLDNGGGGNYVGISADRGPANGWTALYLHLNNDTPGTDDARGTALWAVPAGISVGARVLAGQLIGWRGDSGNAESTGPHIHFELRKGWGWGGTVYNAYPSLVAARRLSAVLPSGPHPSGSLVRHPSGALFVLDGTAKRPVSAAVLAAHGLSAAAAVPMTSAESQGYPTWPAVVLRDGTVARDAGGQLWLVTGSMRVAVSPSDLAALSRPTPRVWPVTEADLSRLPVAASLPASPFYSGALVRTDGTPDVSWVDASGVLRPVDAAALASYGWTSADVAVVPAAAPDVPDVADVDAAAQHRTREWAPEDPTLPGTSDGSGTPDGSGTADEPSGPSYGSPLPLRDGTLVQTRAPAVGVVSGGLFRPLRDARMVASYGYTGRPRLLLPHAAVAALPTAELTAR